MAFVPAPPPPRPEIGFLVLLAGYTFLVLGLSTRSQFIRIYLCLPLSLFFFYRLTFVDSLVQAALVNRLRLSTMGFNGIFRAFELLLCSGVPHTAFVHLEDKKKNIKIAEQSFWARVKWALSLCFSQRGGGWNWRVAGTAPWPPSTTTSSFLLRSFARWIANCLGTEALFLLFTYIGLNTALSLPLMFLHAAVVYTSIHSAYEIGCISWVMLGLGGADECPPLFGALGHSTTLRGFWAKTWHQCFRQSITVIPNRALAVFGLGPDTTGIAAFFLTGAFHAATIYALTTGAITPCFKTFLFFASQPLGLWIESRILGLRPTRSSVKGNETTAVVSNGHAVESKRPNTPIPTSLFRINPRLGYIWVLTWLSLTSRLYFSEMVACGYYDDPQGWVAFPILTRFIKPGLGLA